LSYSHQVFLFYTLFLFFSRIRIDTYAPSRNSASPGSLYWAESNPPIRRICLRSPGSLLPVRFLQRIKTTFPLIIFSNWDRHLCPQ